jgi:hypothetical protein
MKPVYLLLCESLILKGKWVPAVCLFCKSKRKDRCPNKKLIEKVKN